MTAGADTACMFINERMMGIIRIIKTDSMTGKPLPGVTFTVTRLTAPASDDASDVGKVLQRLRRMRMASHRPKRFRGENIELRKPMRWTAMWIRTL